MLSPSIVRANCALILSRPVDLVHFALLREFDNSTATCATRERESMVLVFFARTNKWKGNNEIDMAIGRSLKS